MKNALKLIGIIALVAVIGFSLAACDTGGDDVGDTDGTGGTVNTSLDGVWENSVGMQVTISGSTGILSAFIYANLNAVSQSSIDKGFMKVGNQFWRNLTSTGNLTWSGQEAMVQFATSQPNIATGTTWSNNRTFTMSADGQTLKITEGTNTIGTWTRKQ